VGLILLVLVGTPVLVGAGWRYVRKEQVTSHWRGRTLLVALSLVTLDALLFYAWLVWRLAAGESEQVFAVKGFLADYVTIYMAVAALVPATLGKGTARLCTVAAALFEILLWSNIGI